MLRLLASAATGEMGEGNGSGSGSRKRGRSPSPPPSPRPASSTSSDSSDPDGPPAFLREMLVRNPSLLACIEVIIVGALFAGVSFHARRSGIVF